MNYYITTGDGLYVFRIRKGNYYVSESKFFCGLSKQRARRYAKRLSEMGVGFTMTEEKE